MRDLKPLEYNERPKTIGIPKRDIKSSEYKRDT